MTSLYKQSVPVFIKYLGNMKHLLQIAEKYADEKKIERSQILQYRLIADMRDLCYQVQCVCNTSVWFVDRVGQLEHVAVADDETTFEQLHARLDRTIEYLQKVDASKLDGKVDGPVLIETRIGKFKTETAQAYLSEYAMANFHFHLCTAYCILRTQSVPVGAFDYLRGAMEKVE